MKVEIKNLSQVNMGFNRSMVLNLGYSQQQKFTAYIMTPPTSSSCGCSERLLNSVVHDFIKKAMFSLFLVPFFHDR